MAQAYCRRHLVLGRHLESRICTFISLVVSGEAPFVYIPFLLSFAKYRSDGTQYALAFRFLILVSVKYCSTYLEKHVSIATRYNR